MSAEPASSVPATPGDTTPSLSNQVNAVDFFIKMTMEMQRQLGVMQATVEGLQKTNVDLQQRLSESNKYQEQLTSELKEAKQQVTQFTLKLAESEKANHHLKTEVQNLANQVSEAKINSEREQEQARATAQTLKQQVEQVTARAAQSERTATQIAAKEQGLFAENACNKSRLDRLMHALNSSETLKVGEKQEITGANTRATGFIYHPKGTPTFQALLEASNTPWILQTQQAEFVYESVPVYLSGEVQLALKALGESLKMDEASESNTAAARPAKR